MKVEDGSIGGVLLFTPTPFTDERGFFSRTFDTDVAAAAGVDPQSFRQDSQSRSHRRVIRGMHLRTGAGEAKLVRCSYGAILDVLLDLRPSSPTFRTLATYRLDDVSHRSLYIPAGVAHGWQALTEPADVCYRIDRSHDPREDLTIAHDDPDLAIPWPLPVGAMSERDRSAPRLSEVLHLL
ncbi:dTDP-4-dehydrorhamnose 3,5-epimerase [Jatrophihabitans sp. GAS493]|uniref:dTDP-4-dehydrorhamnose 3,5-epimerase family protein n=1 Tax=Jatrophihabitans sp. GAS493 TaxID=1907575 RepID=UPI000BB8C33D|nr:dTDP-4-dehydrorhamnose 3,5-epimerase [Jatrophihabitans sp. GAS493]SOD75200.1 dTDP-4-dehydrorhamnose 3,5-epimerase [Jatrophihabitans sp. GAS493]